MSKDEITRRWHINLLRAGRVMRRQGVVSREDLLRTFDKGQDYQAVKGIGPVYGAALRRALWELDDAYEWQNLTGMLWTTTYAKGGTDDD